MSAASISIADGQGAATNITDGATTRVTPGNVVTIALQSSTGIQRWIVREDNTNVLASNGPTPADGRGFDRRVDKGGTFSVTFQLPNSDAMIPIFSSVWDGYVETHAKVFLDCRYLGKVTPTINVRGVVMAAMAAYTYTAGTIEADANGAWVDADSDGLTPAVGDRFLVAIGTAADQGAYQFQSVGGASSKFKLVRVPEMAHGMVISAGATYNVSEGTVYKNTVWKNTLAGNCTVGTSSPAPYPRCVTGSVALVAGTTTLSAAILSTTTTNISLHRIVANTSTATTGGYHPTNAGANGITAGAHGTGAAIIQACVAAGTINAADISTISWMITNQV